MWGWGLAWALVQCVYWVFGKGFLFRVVGAVWAWGTAILSLSKCVWVNTNSTNPCHILSICIVYMNPIIEISSINLQLLCYPGHAAGIHHGCDRPWQAMTRPGFYWYIFRKMEENPRTWRKPTAPWSCDTNTTIHCGLHFWHKSILLITINSIKFWQTLTLKSWQKQVGNYGIMFTVCSKYLLILGKKNVDKTYMINTHYYSSASHSKSKELKNIFFFLVCKHCLLFRFSEQAVTGSWDGCLMLATVSISQWKSYCLC